jgi:EmrB/QacA subfamily drug resistance transporter
MAMEMSASPASGPAEMPDGSSPYGALSKPAAILVLVGVFFAILMGAMDGLVVATVLPTIATDLNQVNGVTFVVSAYLVSSTISIPIFARLSDIASRRNVFLLGLTVFIVGSALAGLSQNLTELIVFRGVQGFGGGGVFPVAIAMVAVMFPPKTRARVTGILAGAAGLAIVLGPLVGSYIVSVTTWRWVFYINLPFGIMAMVVLLLAVGPLRPATRGSFDVPGAALLTAWVGALMVALIQVADAGWLWTDPRIIGLLAVAAVMLAVFLWWELRTRQPLVPLRLLGQRVIGASSGTMLFTGVVFSSMITFLSVLVGIVLLQGGPNATGDVRDMIYFLAVPLILGAALSGQILTRVSYRNLIAPGLAVACVAAFFLTDLTSSTPLWLLGGGFLPIGGIALPLIPLGFGLGLSLAGTTIAVQNEAPPAEVGAAIGLTRFLQSLGGALGISLLTVYEFWRDPGIAAPLPWTAAQISRAVATFNELFLILAICIVASFLFSLFFVGKVPDTSTPRPKTDAVDGAQSGGARESASAPLNSRV